jgi:hypothetical protein
MTPPMAPDLPSSALRPGDARPLRAATAGTSGPGEEPRRVVHLLDPGGSGQSCLLGARAVMDATPWMIHHVWMLGTGADDRLALDCGLPITDRVRPGSVVPGQVGHAPALASLRAARFPGAPPDGVVCWSPRAAVAAHRTFGGRVPVLLVLPRGPRAGDAGPLLEAMSLGTVRLAAFSPAGEAWRRLGFQELITLDVPAVACPDWWDDRAQVRAELGIGADEWAVGLIGDPPCEGDARLLSGIVGLLHVGDVRTVGMVDARASQLGRGARFLRSHGRHWDVIPYRGATARAIPAADVLLWGCTMPERTPYHPGASGGLLLATAAMDHGTVVVAPAGGATSAALAHVPECIAAAPTMIAMSKVLIALLSDPALLRSVRERLGDEARRRRGSARFAAQVHVLLNSLAEAAL